MIPILWTRVKLRLKLKSFKTFSWMRRNERFGAEAGKPLLLVAWLGLGEEVCAESPGSRRIAEVGGRVGVSEPEDERKRCSRAYRCEVDGSVVVAIEAEFW